MKDKTGKVTNDRDEILEISSKFYQELYSSRKTVAPPTEFRNTEEVPPFLPEEVSSALNNMKNSKAPGLDGLTSEMIKLGGEQIIKEITELFNKILQSKKIPSKWKEAKIIILHKKGDKCDMKNYRPISLLSHL